MNCLECARTDQLAAPATAACVQCGAGICERHSVERTVQLIRIEGMGREVPVEPLARAFRCNHCDTARQATNPARHERRRRTSSKEHA
jgi:hypothetical protein